MSDTAASKAGSYDTLMTNTGVELDVFIIEDTPARMVVKVLDTGALITLQKHVQ